MSTAPTGDRELNEQPPILRLSDELLELILKYASIGYGASTFTVPDAKVIHSITGEEIKQKSDDGLRRCPHPNVRASHEASWMPLVCRHFRSIFQPLFYRHLELWIGPPCCRYRNRLPSLHATLRGNPALARRCHTLMIEQYSLESLTAEQYIKVFHEILSLTTNLRCLKLVSFPIDVLSESDTDGAGPFACVWERLTSINHVMLIDVLHEEEGYGLGRNMMRSRSNRCNRALQIYGFVSLSRSDVAFLKEGTAPFTTVDIGDFNNDELVLPTIVNWCKTIEHFAYMDYFKDCYVPSPPDDDQTFFHWLLARHRSTVRSLAIGYFHRMPGRPLDVTGLPALETLTILWTTFTANPHCRIDDLDATDAANALLAPKLRNLTLVMETFNRFSDRFSACPRGTHGTELDQWLGQFMEIARQRHSPLQRIRIVYDGRREGCVGGCNFPENVMNPLFEAAKRLDFTLVFEEETIDSWH